MKNGVASLCMILSLTAALEVSAVAKDHSGKQKQRNVVIFIADGLRPGSVNSTDAPTLLSVRNKGVFFANSHSLFPTFTTANASAIATGHYLGDTGDFSNTIYSGYPIFNSGNFGKTAGTVTPFVENDQILADLDEHYDGNYLSEETLLSLARKKGYNTAAIGKLGPVAIQDVSQLDPVSGAFIVPTTVIIDDATGSASGVPLRADVIAALTNAGLSTIPTPRNQPSGTNTTPGTVSANIGQQQWFADATTKAVLPMFQANGKPFVLVFWSRDPDGTQHNQGDSLNSLTPGINGPTSKAAVKNADNNLKQILDFINSDSTLVGNTDVFVTADHGFATISKHEVNAAGSVTKSYAASLVYKTAAGVQEVNTGFLPVGFLAIDISHTLGLPLYDPDSQITVNGRTAYEPVDPTITQQTATVRQHPAPSLSPRMPK
jgi:predicted AlkP superfamily pyrophosphatase or phosphodiesterase